MKTKYLKAILPLVTIIALGVFATFNVNASLDSKSASDFSQYCSQNSNVCNKVDFTEATSGTVSCPNQNQSVIEMYVHAGDGQTVYKLPHEGFDYAVNGNSTLVTLSGHPHGISWIAVVCGSAALPTPSALPSHTPSPSPTLAPTPTVTPSPTHSPSPSPSPSATPTPKPTPTPIPTPQAKPGSIQVCKVILDENGNTTSGSQVPGVTFSVGGLTPISNSGEGPGGILPKTTFTTPLTLNADLLGNDGKNDATCVTYNNLATGDFFYSQETISATSGWGQPKYNDQFTVTVRDINSFFNYDDGLFKHGYSDNKNSDGNIILQNTRPNRTLVLLNTIKPGAVASPTPSPTPAAGSTGGNNNSQSQSQTQNNNQTVNVTVNQGTVLGTSTPKKQPETGVSVLGLASFFSAAPFGLMLSRFGRGRGIYKRKEELGNFALEAFESRKLKSGLDNS
jgi:hypothetical protein